MNTRLLLPNKVKYIIEKLEQNGFQAYIIGGCVRDCLFGKDPHDWDIATNARPNDIKHLFKKCFNVGEAFGTIVVNLDGEDFEVTTYRSDGRYSDGRKPDSVEYADSLLEDIKRRDLTINGIAYNDREGIVDYVGGVQDIKDKRIRFIGDARDRIREDYLRALRALRFEIVLDGFHMDADTKQICKTEIIENYKKLSAERIQAEINKVLSKRELNELDKIADFFMVMADTIIPELQEVIGLDQKNKYHQYDAFEHTIRVVAGTPNVIALRWAALLHDIGKKRTMTLDDKGQGHFLGHSEVSAKMAEVILRKLKLSNIMIKNVTELIKYHDSFKSGVSKTKLRMFMSSKSIEFMEMLLLLREADLEAHIATPSMIEKQQEFNRLVKEIQDDGSAITLSQLQINGDDLYVLADIPKGPVMKEILTYLLHSCHGNPKLNNRKWLLAEAKRIYSSKNGE